MAARVAGPEPERAPKNTQAMTQTMARPPRMLPTRELAKSTSFFASPPETIRFPDRMKKGQASNVKESMPERIAETVIMGEALFVSIIGRVPARPITKARGTSINATTKKIENIRMTSVVFIPFPP